MLVACVIHANIYIYIYTYTWLVFGSFLKYIFLIPARNPGIPHIGRGRRPQTPQISSNSPRKSLIFEAGVGDRLATLRVSRAKR